MKLPHCLRRSRDTRLTCAVSLALAIGLCVPTSVAQQSTRLPVIGDGTAAISGTVTDAATGRPLAGAIVTLTPVSGTATGLSSRQVTNETGRFLFTDLEEGDGYRLSAGRLGYIGIGIGPQAQPGAAKPIVLARGEWVAERTMALARPGAINGTITDEAGEPVVGAFVRVLTEIFVAGATRAVPGPVTRTDDRGVYRLAGLAPGAYYVSVPSIQMSVPASTSLLTLSGLTAEAVAKAEAAGRPPSFRRDPAVRGDAGNHLLVGSFVTPPPMAAAAGARAYPVLYYPAARRRAEAARIEVAASEDRRGVDLRLVPESVVRVSGRVEGPPEALADLTLRLLIVGDEDVGPGAETATAMVAPSGAFTFLNVPAGRYTVDASRAVGDLNVLSGSLPGRTMLPTPPGAFAMNATSALFLPTPVRNMGSLSGGVASGFFGRARVDVGATDVVDVVVRVGRGVTMRGTLVTERTQPESARQVRSLVIAEPAGGEPALGSFASTSPPGDPSSFAIEGLRAGEYLLRASAGVVKSITWAGSNYSHRPFDTTAGSDIDGVVVTVTDQVVRFSGSVRDRSGVPVTSAAVLLFPAEREQWRRYGQQPARVRVVAVSSASRFVVDRIPAGDYFLIALDPGVGPWPHPQFLEKAVLQATRVSIEWGETRTQDLVLQQVR